MNKRREFIKQVLTVISGCLVARPIELINDQPIYKIKAIAIKSSVYESIEFDYQGDQVNIGDIVTYKDKIFRSSGDTPLDRISNKYAFQDLKHEFKIISVEKL